MENAVLATIDAAVIGRQIASDLNTRFNLNISSEVFDVRERGDNVYAKLEVEQNFGAFNMIIANAWINLRCQNCEDGSIWVLISLDYNHPGGGRNGRNIGQYWFRDGKIETSSLENDITGK